MGRCVFMHKNTHKDTQMSGNLSGLQGKRAEMEGGFHSTSGYLGRLTHVNILVKNKFKSTREWKALFYISKSQPGGGVENLAVGVWAAVLVSGPPAKLLSPLTYFASVKTGVGLGTSSSPAIRQIHQHAAQLPTPFGAQSQPATRPRLRHPTARHRAPRGSLAPFLSCQEKPASFQATLNLEILPRALTTPQNNGSVLLNACCSKCGQWSRGGLWVRPNPRRLSAEILEYTFTKVGNNVSEWLWICWIK